MEEKKTELKMIKMSEVQSQEIEWLWYPFIPYGKLTIVQGDPGDGKTTFILNIAAKLSKGEGMDNDMKLTEPMNIIYQTAEDGLADTVKPRLESAGADCERIVVIDESDKSLSMADERLEEAIIQTGARMLILDPIQAYLGGGMDMNRANEARDMTKRLGALAEKYKCAIILIGHMNKASGNKAAYRGMGSIDFFAVARSVLLVGRVEGEPNIRAVECLVVLPQKQINWSRQSGCFGNWKRLLMWYRVMRFLIWLRNRGFLKEHWKMPKRSWALGQEKSITHGIGNWIR